uniref:Uncharacterized protein n=1 Tax=Salix viminalis TaxID=40686 RepID=A0A6N2MKD7_SALVM
MNAITVPSAPVTANFGSQTAFTLAAQLVDGQPEPPCGVIEIGRVNSAKEAGGIAPAPLHSTTPEAQSAVAQTNFPDASVEHCVLAQKRPAHVAGALSEDEAPAANVKPVEDNAGLPGFAITVPSAPVTANFGSQTAFTLAAQLVDGQPEPPCGVIEIGRVNSAKEAGGIAPAPLHSMTPEAQSAVAQTNFPDASVEHCVLAQKRPAHVAGALREDEAPAANVKPVEDNAGLPGFVRAPGQTVYGHLFVKEKQYCGWLNAKHALLQAITVPSAPVTANFGSQTAFTLAAQLVDGQPEPPCGVIEIGVLPHFNSLGINNRSLWDVYCTLLCSSIVAG